MSAEQSRRQNCSWEMMENNKSTLKATVRGFVQGVGFRVFVRSIAWNLHLKGYVKNMPDGTVQVMASGVKSSLDKLIAEIWRGPAGAHISSVDVAWQDAEPIGLPATFEVKR